MQDQAPSPAPRTEAPPRPGQPGERELIGITAANTDSTHLRFITARRREAPATESAEPARIG
ncbi:conserved protein of unknown function [Rhodovastum atsumiense]|uniref:Uncharacterized protein n=1 Tax=Rhodovastum atsumiense TaxID=504468 RepID=A0A5M6IWX2_9PROT|nr:hypothetical protein [Rhodovastum atsumiense]KAA5612741.1 hypothetical protein F1189_08375 [Rhodovastum atsumiense]CAH2602701.1 conserved protein of unknown function [Rhodovastum atsumiense]